MFIHSEQSNTVKHSEKTHTFFTPCLLLHITDVQSKDSRQPSGTSLHPPPICCRVCMSSPKSERLGAAENKRREAAAVFFGEENGASLRGDSSVQEFSPRCCVRIKCTSFTELVSLLMRSGEVPFIPLAIEPRSVMPTRAVRKIYMTLLLW